MTSLLTDADSTKLKTLLEQIYPGETPEDRDDVLDYILAMLTNGKTIPNVLLELEGIVETADVGKIGVCLEQFMKNLGSASSSDNTAIGSSNEIETSLKVNEEGGGGEEEGGDLKDSSSSTIKSLRAVKEV